MPNVPFDTHAVIQDLERLGFPLEQAEGLSHVLQTIVASTDYATKADVTEASLRLEVTLEAMKGDMSHLKWGLGLLLGGVVSLVLKAYFHF